MAGLKRIKRYFVILGIILIALLLVIFIMINSRQIFEQYCLWYGSDDYQYRIPGIICTGKGTLIAYCEQRRSLDDWSEINIVERISTDAGKSWGDTIIIVDGISREKTVNNPVMIADGATVHLLYAIDLSKLTNKTNLLRQWHNKKTHTKMGIQPTFCLYLLCGRCFGKVFLAYLN